MIMPWPEENLVNEDEEDVSFEPIKDMDTEDIRDMIIGYVKASDRMKLVEMLATCRDLFFE